MKDFLVRPAQRDSGDRAGPQPDLSKEESALLKQSLLSLRLAFVEAVESKEPAPAAAPTGASPPPEQKKPEPSIISEEEHPKKFSKKY